MVFTSIVIKSGSRNLIQCRRYYYLGTIHTTRAASATRSRKSSYYTIISLYIRILRIMILANLVLSTSFLLVLLSTAVVDTDLVDNTGTTKETRISIDTSRHIEANF